MPRRRKAGPSNAGERAGADIALLSGGDESCTSLRIGVLGIWGLAVFVLIVVIDVDADNLEVKEWSTGERGGKCVDMGEEKEGEKAVVVGVMDVGELLVGEKGMLKDVSDGLDERVRVGERRLATD